MNRNIYHTIIMLHVFLMIGRAVNAQDKHGFVQQEIIRVPGITTDAAINALSNIQKQTTRTYTDGMGRVLQTVGVDASPLQNDMIQPVSYDNLGRQIKAYLPYAGQAADTIGVFRNNALTTAQKAFYNQTSQYLIATDTNAFTQQVFENSPLQRMLKSGTVGVGFQPLSGQHFKTVSYRYNTSAQDGNIPVWNPDGTFTASNYYVANALSVTDGIDEDNAETLTFTDKAGHMVLKRQKLSGANLDTYYIYNLAGMISYIVPPKAVSLMGGTLNLTTTGVNKLIYRYVYDNLGRPVEKTVPAQGRLFIIYDPLNRPVLMQDSNMRIVNKWNYVKYDVKGRPVSQGIYTDVTRTSRTAMQTYVSGLASGYNTAWYETRTATLTNSGYYTSAIFPTGSTGTLTPLAYAYFDDYDTDLNGSANFSYIPQGLPGETTPAATTAAVKDMPTAVCKTTVGSGISGTWLTKVTFYDKRGNPIQTQSNNHMYYSGMLTLTDKSTTVPDFMGVPQVNQVSKQTGASTTITVQTSFTYDHMNRVKTVSQGYNSGAATVVAAYTYNELGQVVKKSLGFVSAGTYLQNLDMRYNVRGQLLSINNSKLSNDAGQTNGDTNDLFGLQMLYDKTDANLGNTAYYNGKLSAVKWMSKDGSGNSSYERAFRYYYDAMGRDTAAIYAERTTAGTGAFSVTHGWDENRISYDQNGNIMAMFRNSTTQGSGGHAAIDNLSYTYDTANPNQLKSVSDASGSTAGFRGGTGNYTYDGNGNLASDPYKGLSALAYNVLNRTDKISFSSSVNRYIDYTYDAGGYLIRKRQYDNVGGVATLQNTTDYIDGFVYLNGTLQYFAMPEGRVLNSAGTLSREFTIADQQGNVRISFDNTGTGGTAKVRQENSYYAFGMIMPGSTVGTPTNDNKHLYNGGSEWQNDFANLPDYYQTYNRNYDAAIARWVGVDPNPESAESLTVYQYAGNNPILYNDPLGDKARLPETIPSPPPGGFSGTNVDNNDTWAAASEFVLTGGGGFGGVSNAVFGTSVGYAIYSNIGGSPIVGSLGAAVAVINDVTGYATGSKAKEATSEAASLALGFAGISDKYPNMLPEVKVTASHSVIFPSGWGNSSAFTIQGDGSITRKIGPFAYSISVNENNSGVDMEIFYKEKGKVYPSYNFIQTVESYPSEGKVNPHLDGFNIPFYLTKEQVDASVKIARSIGYTIGMNDHPHNESSFRAITTVVGINNEGVSTTLGTLNWGFWLDNGGIVHIREVTYSH